MPIANIAGSTDLEFNPAVGYIAFSELSARREAPRCLLSPVVLSPGHAPRPLSLEWDGEAAAVAIRIPEDVRAPFLITFTLDNNVLEDDVKAKKPLNTTQGEQVEHEGQAQQQKPTKTVVGKIDVCANPPTIGLCY